MGTTAQAERVTLSATKILDLKAHGLISLEVATDAMASPSPRKAWLDTVLFALMVALLILERGTALMYVMPLVTWLSLESLRDSWSEYLEDKREHEIAVNVCLEALEESEARR